MAHLHLQEVRVGSAQVYDRETEGFRSGNESFAREAWPLVLQALSPFALPVEENREPQYWLPRVRFSHGGRQRTDIVLPVPELVVEAEPQQPGGPRVVAIRVQVLTPSLCPCPSLSVVGNRADVKS